MGTTTRAAQGSGAGGRFPSFQQNRLVWRVERAARSAAGRRTRPVRRTARHSPDHPRTRPVRRTARHSPSPATPILNRLRDLVANRAYRAAKATGSALVNEQGTLDDGGSGEGDKGGSDGSRRRGRHLHRHRHERHLNSHRSQRRCSHDCTVDFRPLRRPTNAHIHFNQPWAPIRTPRHQHDKFHSLEKMCFADRHAMHNPTVHVVPGVCTAILSTNDCTVDFRPLRRPTNAHISASPGHPSGRPDAKTKNSTHMKNVFADRRAMHNPTPHVVPGVCTAILSKNDRTVDFQAWRRPT